MCHMVIAWFDNQSLNSPNIAVDRMHMVAATHANPAQGSGIECDGPRHTSLADATSNCVEGPGDLSHRSYGSVEPSSHHPVRRDFTRPAQRAGRVKDTCSNGVIRVSQAAAGTAVSVWTTSSALSGVRRACQKPKATRNAITAASANAAIPAQKAIRANSEKP